MIRFKPEVRIKTFNPELTVMFIHLSMWSEAFDRDVHVASIDDGQHGNNTLHGLSLAMDCNPDSMTADDREALYQYMRRTMPDHYDVICESDHVHVEWDIKRPESRISSRT